MKYLFVTLIFSFTFGLVSAQNNSTILPTLQKYSNKVYVGNVSVDNVQKYLQQHQPHLMQPNVSLQWQQTQQSPLGTHYTFVQQYKGMPIYGTSIKATINKSNYLVLIMDNTFDVSLLKHPITPNNNRQANAIAQQFLQTKNEALDNAQTLICFTSPSTIIEAIVLKARNCCAQQHGNQPVTCGCTTARLRTLWPTDGCIHRPQHSVRNSTYTRPLAAHTTKTRATTSRRPTHERRERRSRAGDVLRLRWGSALMSRNAE